MQFGENSCTEPQVWDTGRHGGDAAGCDDLTGPQMPEADIGIRPFLPTL